MTNVACFCGCFYSFDRGKGTSPRCGAARTPVPSGPVNTRRGPLDGARIHFDSHNHPVLSHGRAAAWRKQPAHRPPMSGLKRDAIRRYARQRKPAALKLCDARTDDLRARPPSPVTSCRFGRWGSFVSEPNLNPHDRDLREALGRQDVRDPAGGARCTRRR
jgi:hypothetical protein